MRIVFRQCILGWTLAASLSASPLGAAPEILVVGDGPAGEVPPGVLALLSGRSIDLRIGGDAHFEDMAAYRVVVWASGTNLAPFFHSSVKAELARYLDSGGSVLVTGDACGAPLGSGPFTDVLARYLRARHAGRAVTSRVAGVFSDRIGSGLDMALDRSGVETFSAPRSGRGGTGRPVTALGGPGVVLTTDMGSGSRPVAIRAEGPDWPPHRILVVGFDLARAPRDRAHELLGRALSWLSYPPREDFERVLALRGVTQGRPGPDDLDLSLAPPSAVPAPEVAERVTWKALVALRTLDGALGQLEELLRTLPEPARRGFAPLVRDYARSIAHDRGAAPPRLAEVRRLTGLR